MRAVIAQSEVVTAYGWGLDALWDGLMAGRCPIIASNRFVERGFVSNQIAMVPDLHVAAGDSRAISLLRPLIEKLQGKLDPLTPLILATTVGEIENVERAVLEENHVLAPQASPQTLLGRVKDLLGLQGDAMVVSTACASSSAALTRAASMIRHGTAASVLVVTCDAVSEFVYSGFSALLSLSDTPARPFDEERNGLTLGEAAGWTLVTSDASPLASNSSTTILGWGNTTDAVHMTAPHREGNGLTRAISHAIAMAECPARDIAFVAAHGTATIYSDAMELAAFRSALETPRPVFSVKGGTGHTLAAAGLVQILVAGRALSLGVVPPTVGLKHLEPAAIGWATTKATPLDSATRALSTNSGFGGVNTAVVLGRGLA